METKIYSIGHSNRAFSEFLKKLQENEINIVVDVRTYPRSRFCPWFNEKRLATGLNAYKITYLPKCNNLGGLGENTRYEETLDELIELSEAGLRVCLMCSEADYKKCHRYQTITPSLESRGVQVEHIEYN